MRISTRASATIALALLMAAAAGAFLAAGQNPRAEPTTLHAMAPPATHGVMPCLYHVMIIHDVHWAAACMKNETDDSPDCMLPTERAAVLNKAQQEAEGFCERRGI